MSGLAPNTVYHYRLVADGGGVSRGANRTFRTPAVVLPPPPEPAKLQLARATIFRSAKLIDILAPITKRASGTVAMQLYAAGKRHRWTAPINSTAGHIRGQPADPRRAGPDGHRHPDVAYPATRTRARRPSGSAPPTCPPRSTRAGPRIVNGRLQAGGTVSRAARGVVRVQLQYFSGEQTITLEKYARISGGAWSLDEPLTPEEQAAIAARRGTVHSYILYTGYLKARMRGEMRSYQVLGPR